MTSTYFPLVLPVDVVAKIDQRAKAHGLARTAYVVGLLTNVLSSEDLPLPLPLSHGSINTGPAAKGARSKTISLLVSTALKRQLATKARELVTTQAAICRAIIMAEINESLDQEGKERPPKAVTVTVPALNTSVPDSVDRALRDICRQLSIYGRPTMDSFPNAEEQARHFAKTHFLASLTTALFGHRVNLTESDVRVMFMMFGPRQSVAIAALLNVGNFMEIFATAAAVSDQTSEDGNSPQSPVSDSP